MYNMEFHDIENLIRTEQITVKDIKSILPMQPHDRIYLTIRGAEVYFTIARHFYLLQDYYARQVKRITRVECIPCDRIDFYLEISEYTLLNIK